MKKIHLKTILTISLALLFLITSIGQARATAGQAKTTGTDKGIDNLIVKGLNKYIWEPTVDLAVFTGQNLGRTFKSFPPAVAAAKGYFKGTAYLGKVAEDTLGALFNKTGNLLAGVGQHLPNLPQVSQDTGNFVASSIAVFDQSGQIFKAGGDVLAIIPNNLPNLTEVSVDLGNLLINSGERVNEAVAFFQETYNNLTSAPQKQSYPRTQNLISNARRNLENNFNRIIGATSAEANQIK
jgi:hypothetical protein